MSGVSEIAKAGWLHRQSSVLHRWKKNWFTLGRDGLLRYFDSPNSPRAEEVFILRTACARIKTGPEVRPTAPPEELSSGKMCMFELEMRDGNHLLLCAESADDMRAWQYTLEEARTAPPPAAPMGAMGYPPSVGYASSAGYAPSVGYAPVMPMNYQYRQYPYGMSYGSYPGQVINQAPAQVIQTPNGTTTFINQPTQLVYMDDHPYRNRRRHYGGPGTTYLSNARHW